MARRGRPKSDAVAVVPKPPKLTREEVAKLPKRLKALVRVKSIMKDPLKDFIARSGGREHVYWLFKRSPHQPIAVKIVQAWESLLGPLQGPGSVNIDQVLELTELYPIDFADCMFRCGWDIGINYGKSIVAQHFAQMMDASMKKATSIDGTEERRMHFQATGYLPTSKGIQIQNINQQVAEDQSPGHAPSFRQTARAVVRDLPPARDD